MSSDRFHKAARDGNLDILKEATSTQCNARDEDGMTPTLWAAFEGHLNALSLLVGRGGDVDRCDNFGNTALHFAAARGHKACVTFLINWGANLWAMDIDFHTPMELAAMNNRDDIVRLLDSATAKEEESNTKLVETKKKKAQKAADKLARSYTKLQEKTRKQAEKEQQRLAKERKRMQENGVPIVSNMPHRPSTVLEVLKGLRRGRSNSLKQPTAPPVNPTFSDLVSGGGGGDISGGSIGSGGGRNGLRRKAGFKGTSGGTRGVAHLVRQRAKSTTALNAAPPQPPNDDFKIREIEADGKQSIRSLTGLRRDSQIIYTGSFESPATGKRGRLQDVVFDTSGDLSRCMSEPDLLHNTDSGFGDEVLLQEPASIFDRPGFGSVAFRNNITAVLTALPTQEDQDSAVGPSERGVADDTSSIGSAGSLRRNNGLPWDDDDLSSDEDDEATDSRWTSLHLFLVSAGLAEYTSLFVEEKIDLEALMLLDANDFEKLGLKMGPIKKLTKAIQKRREALESPGEVSDSKF
ncbi:ankyrin repeat and SAM domain-containing protein 4B [Schistocerca cancellata]|uniref:ankyrin repeat and SAM domain-containing protein 4B n=1 Tax=Schistocerca cancellata TaxID=274614 RepID=UPI0021183000|nr:ankyrin repeat and SAM domain-containing protein 4B [Schistocerca cancellata]